MQDDYAALLARKQEINDRLTVLSVHPPPLVSSKRRKTATDDGTAEELPPLVREKTDTHWDYLLKELQWLSTDFQAERKRHVSAARKLAHAVRQYHQHKETRQLKELAEAEVKRRRLAAKIARNTKNWWSKLERVISYKQKLSDDRERHNAMNQQLVALVKQTERYSEALARNASNDHCTIEQALAEDEQLSDRRSRLRITDYNRIQLPHEQDAFYGTSTAEEESGSDASYSPGEEELVDDESTLNQAMSIETLHRRRQEDNDDDERSYLPDFEELRKLQEEQYMEVEQILERLRSEAPDQEYREEQDDEASVENGEDSSPERAIRQDLQLTRSDKLSSEQPRANYATIFSEKQPRDIGDESPEEANTMDDDEYEPAPGGDVDDETTMEAEEKLSRDMTYEQELELLQRESEIPVEELRAMYASMENSVKGESDSSEEKGESLEEDLEEPSLTRLLAPGINDDGDCDEYQPDEVEAVDDETTIEAEEKLGRDMSYEDEIALLKQESEMPIDQLRSKYAALNEESSEEKVSRSALLDLVDVTMEDQENDDDFRPFDEEVDDETTMEAEERLGRDISIEEEINILRKDSEVPIEELRGIYSDLYRPKEDTKEEESPGESSPKRKHENEAVVETTRKKARVHFEGEMSDVGQKALAVLEASAERARNTLASRPYLLAPWVKLREYQQIGLNWLVSLQSRRLNGILADEMGLGKTLQTIGLLAYLAAYKGIWGPHLIIVPTSVILNWETELKRFCPALKVLCYYGSAKRRKELRSGWTKTNWYHVVITSYQLAVQDAFAFKRKKWYYLVLDEAQNIKNFQSQRWQTLINFNTQRRLLLTGTPLQNSLMELWSLLHFLMPYIFRSRKEFSYWFANPMNNMIEGKTDHNDDMIGRLHGIIRPFVLRRLKKDVETQMPGKYEHIIKCQLSRRQMFIYEEFMTRSSTRQALKKGGNFMGMMNVLMQLRKVCNHPDLFEPRSIVTPLALDRITLSAPNRVFGIIEESRSVFNTVSERILVPLWCGSCGGPSLDACMRHDSIEADLLEKLEAPITHSFVPQNHETIEYDDVPALKELLSTEHRKVCLETEENIRRTGLLNVQRCRAKPFPYPDRVLRLLRLQSTHSHDSNFNILSTPCELLKIRRTQNERADEMDEIFKKFVFCVPKAGSQSPVLGSNIKNSAHGLSESTLNTILLEPLEEYFRPFRKAHARLSSFFPDKKLIQYDAGKLQTLAELLRELKRGDHKVLIFTQMSRMLDILEAFLNLNGHTYLRLDGATGVDRRQRLMDRFNNDPRIFCFILSTRSGGLGINLTGADTVIFYDSDWNPAMDAQAQDRAHRIGQTRDVHIFRLVTEHTIEENILIKAQQKRNLDILVMDKGKFDASQLFSHDQKFKSQASEQSEAHDVYTKGGLRAILGVDDNDDEADTVWTDKMEVNDTGDDGRSEKHMSSEDMEKAMTSLEDVDDVQALRGAQKEAAEEMKEFDESVEYKKESDNDDDEEAPESKSENVKPEDEKEDEAELAKEFATWQDSVGVDTAAIENSLCAVERYGLKYREDIDPFYSIFAVREYQRKLAAESNGDGGVDIDEIEREKDNEEQRAIEEGDLLVTDPSPEELIRQRNMYRRERARLRATKLQRKLTGEDWQVRIDGLTNLPFYYNVDTGEAIWDKPQALHELEEYNRAAQTGWGALPLRALVHCLGYLPHYPDRSNCSEVSKYWLKAANDPSFIRHVYPVELGAHTRDECKMDFNHYRSLSDAVKHALPGETIELGDGHYWVTEDLIIDIPLCIIGDEHNPANVIVELNKASIIWRAIGGWCEGVTFRRPKLAGAEESHESILRVDETARLDVINSVFDNEGSTIDAVKLTGRGSKGKWENVMVKGGTKGISIHSEASLVENNVICLSR